MLCKIQIIGNLGRDPELRYTPNGAAVANFTVAVTPRRPDGQGGWTDGDTSFLRCTAWRGLAEHVVPELAPGSPEGVPVGVRG